MFWMYSIGKKCRSYHGNVEHQSCSYRPEAINQLGFIAEKILSRKHKEFMTEINEVTHSLQDSATSNYRDENISFGDARRQPVKATETAVDLLQSFAISTPTTMNVKKVVATKSFKQSRPSNSQDISTVVTKEECSSMVKTDKNQEVTSSNEDVLKQTKCHKHQVILSSSEESETYDVPSPAVTPLTVTDEGTASTIDNSFTTLLHNELYPCYDEEVEVKWSSRTAAITTTNEIMLMGQCKRYSCFIHPAVPWLRCRSLRGQSNSKITHSSNEEQLSKDNSQEPQSTDEVGLVPDKAGRQSARLRKRRRESEHLSSDSDDEPVKTITADNSAANEQVDATPTGTRTSKRVRRAPIKLRQ